MPEFILDHGTPEASKQFAALDEFTQGYVEAMFFTDTPEDEAWTVAGLLPDSWQRIIADCAEFQRTYADDLQEAYDQDKVAYGPDQAGRDFWYTRQGHGVGFWDRGLQEIGDKLARNAKTFGKCWPSDDDDGNIYIY